MIGLVRKLSCLIVLGGNLLIDKPLFAERCDPVRIRGQRSIFTNRGRIKK